LDIVIYVLGLILPFILTLLALLVKMDKWGNFLLGGFSSMGGLVGVYFFLAVGQSGSLFSGATLLTSAASGTAFEWDVITYIPLIFGFMAFISAIYSAVLK
jgi:hypothetical protein